MKDAPLRIGNVAIEGDLILAPMDGVTDMPFRVLTRRLGSAMSYTEFVNAQDVIRGHPLLEKRTHFLEEERPVVFQLFDDDPDRLLQSALVLISRKPDIIDINMGCPAKTVSGRGAGAALMRSPKKVAAIFSMLSRALDIPITGKIRLGWDEASQNYLEIAHIIEDNGGKCIAVHARTKEQAYGGEVNWAAIAEIKQVVSIPVIGNGDVRCVDDIERLLTQTGCDAVMIGRAALENPWLFSRIERHAVPPEQVIETMRSHSRLMTDFHGAEYGLILFRKFLKGYMKPYHLERAEIGSLLTTTSEEFLWGQVERIVLGHRKHY